MEELTVLGPDVTQGTRLIFPIYMISTIGYHVVPSGILEYHWVPSGIIGNHSVTLGTFGIHWVRFQICQEANHD